MSLLATLLPHLPVHLPTLIQSTTLFFAIQLASFTLSSLLFPRTMKGWNKRQKVEWSSKVVALVHSLLILPMAYGAHNDPQLRKDVIFGFNARVGQVLAFTSGYFIWDTIDSILNSSTGFVVHAIAGLAGSIFGFRPFGAYFGPCFMLWELSTPMLNLRYFFTKFGIDKKYPTVSTLNDLLFVIAFFLARIVGGSKDSFLFVREMVKRRNEIPMFLFTIYGIGTLALNALNWLWFSKIVKRSMRTFGVGGRSAGGRRRGRRRVSS